jgi:hypothetical protein
MDVGPADDQTLVVRQREGLERALSLGVTRRFKLNDSSAGLGMVEVVTGSGPSDPVVKARLGVGSWLVQLDGHSLLHAICLQASR